MVVRRFIYIPLVCFTTLVAIAFRAEALEPDQVFEKASASIVTVETINAAGRIVGLGSGVVIAPGEVITNCHVVEDGVSWRVKKQGQTSPAYPRFYDKTRDLCQLQATQAASFTRPVRGLVAMDDLRVGQRVYAIGAPQGFELTLRDGLISGLRRSEDGSIQLIQTTAPISPGSSGGGLFDQDGHLVGITTLTLSESQNLNFAVPVSGVLELSSRQADLIEQRRKLEAEERTTAAATELKRRDQELGRREEQARASEEAAAQATVLEEKKRRDVEARTAAALAELQRREEDLNRREREVRSSNEGSAAPTERQAAQNQAAASDAYVHRVQDKVQRLFNYLPHPNGDLKAELELSIMASGWLVGAGLVASSGDPQFDATVLGAIWAADPLYDAREVVPFEGIRDIRIVVRAVPADPVARAALPTPPKLKRGDEDAALKLYALEVSRIIGKAVSERDYPRLARERGWEGLTTVRVEVGPDGLLKAAP